MVKYRAVYNIAFISMVILCCEATVVKVPFNGLFTLLDENAVVYENEVHLNWQNHIMDFVKLVNMEKVLSTAFRFIDDPEAMRFIGFLLSPKFREMVWELELMDEFKEAYIFLSSKGYDLQPVIDVVNAGLSLPQFPKPQMMLRYNAGVSGFLAAMVGALPIEEMRELLKNKEENYSEVAEFLNIIKSSEFTDVMKRMLASTKFAEFKTTFESYGVDFTFVCEIIKEIAGDDYQSFLCESYRETVFV